jgi:hypothetical protein
MLAMRDEEKRGVEVDLGGLSLKRSDDSEEKRGVEVDLGGLSLKRGNGFINA